jgi:hypothetical protein
MYFIQVIAGNNKKTIKVLTVGIGSGISAKIIYKENRANFTSSTISEFSEISKFAGDDEIFNRKNSPMLASGS